METEVDRARQLYKKFSPSTKAFIRENLNAIFLNPVHEHYCCSSKDRLKICHIDTDSCFTKNKMFGCDNACQEFVNMKFHRKFFSEGAFAEVSQDLHFACCLMEVGDLNFLVYRHWDDKFGMIQWDRIVHSKKMWKEMKPVAEAMKAFYQIPMMLIPSPVLPEKMRAMGSAEKKRKPTIVK